jgi:putative ABC transport system permease protein
MLLSPLHWLAQAVVVTMFSLRSLPQRKGAAAAAAFGIAGVVAVLVGMLSIAQGFRHAMTTGGSPAVALVFRSGADTEMTSIMNKEETRIIASAPTVTASSAELYVSLELPKRSTGTEANVPLRGVEAPAYRIRKGLRLIEGRRFEPGRNEVIAGCGAVAEFCGVDLGAKLDVNGQQWTIVGIFSDDGGVAESEIWADTSLLAAAYQRGTTFESVHARLGSADDFDRFKAALSADPRLNVKVVRETDYYAEQSRVVTNLITTLGTLVAALMGIGAVFGALNTMYSAVASRTREMATLRALGFGGGAVIVSVLAESLVLALAGGVAGGGAAYLMFNGYRAATMNLQSFNQVAFAFAVTPRLLAQGVAYAAMIGLIGGFFPALRAARQPVAAGLRAF